MNAEGPRSPVPLRQRREVAIARLCEHFARDDVDADELERLIDRAHLATTPAALERLFEGLPSLADQSEVKPTATPLAPRPVEARQTVVAIMGGVEHKGRWTPAREVWVVAVMGGALLDFRDARLTPEGTKVNVVTVMGGVEIIVPPGMRVSSDGVGIMGGFGHAGEPEAEGGEPEAAAEESTRPSLRITGLALMGGVEITERNPGE